MQIMEQAAMIVAFGVAGGPDHPVQGRAVEDHAVAAGCYSAATGEQDSLEVQDHVEEGPAVVEDVPEDLCIVQQRDYEDYSQ